MRSSVSMSEVHVAHADALLVQVFGEVLGHALGQRRDQHAIAALGAPRGSREQVVDLGFAPGASRPADRSGRSGGSPARRTAAGALHLPGRPASPRRRSSAAHRLPLLELQRPVVDAPGRRKPYSTSVSLRARSRPLYMPPICGTVTWLSSTNTSALSRQVFEQRRRRLAGLRARTGSANSSRCRRRAGRLDHLEVEGGALLEPLRLEQLARSSRTSSSSRSRSSSLMPSIACSSVGARRDVVLLGRP
jgi:hypothetical protein